MNERVLVVDDSLTVRMNLVEILETAGFTVVACATAEEGRRAFAAQAFALAILDVLLPDGDGVDLLKELRDMGGDASPPIMLLSTEAEVRDRIRGLTTGADEYIGKPYDPAYLVARARELLRRHHIETEPAGEAVLIVDDSPTFLAQLKTSIEEAGFRVLTAATGEEGLRVAADSRPQAMIVDGVLPGIDGATVIRRIRLDAALRRLPCLLLTASEDRDAELRALEAGADAFVRKGEDTAMILARLNAVLRSAPAQASDLRTASLLAPKKILTVDDSETYLQGVAETMRGEGYEVVLARSGEEALDLLAVQPVDCILLDLVMPGIGGEETCLRLKATPVTRDIPIIMLTSLENRDAMIRGLGAGADDYIAKSSDLEVLRARVLAQMRRKQFEDENRAFREQLLRRELETAEARAAQQVAETRAALVGELEQKNKELEAFSYSVSHDLRAPLRSIDGFSQALMEDHAASLDRQGLDYLRRVRAAAQRMGELIDDLLQLSRVGRAPLRRELLDLSALARGVAASLKQMTPERDVAFVIAEGLSVEGDPGLLRAALENLLGNAWKFTGTVPQALIELGASHDQRGTLVYFVRDNGVGFDETYADKLFAPFQRLHSEADFPGTGIGLATVQRIVERHGGRIWAESDLGHGATFYWTLWNHLLGNRA
jgi:DNA-binding response OmpR family regulator